MTVAQWIITAGGVVGALAVIHATLIRPAIRWAMRLEKAVAFVESNLVNNGGSSLRDAVDRIEARLETLEKKSQSSTVRRKSTTK